jgi:uncharacterized protein (DUF736 family)
MIIGKFTHHETDDRYLGDIIAGFSVMHAVEFVPAARGPDYVVATPYGELGAAWKKTSAKGRPYLSVRLDGPLLAKPIDCALVRQNDSAHVLVWSRDTRAEPGEAG